MRTRLRTPFRIAPLLLALACGGGGGPSGPPDDDDNFDGDGRVGPAGGTVGLGDDAQIVVPPGALTEEVEIRITPVATPADLVAEGAIGQAYRYDPIALTFAAGVRIVIEVPAAARGARPLTDVTLRRSTLVIALTPAGELLSNIQHGSDDVSGTTSRLGVFSAALPALQNRNPTAGAGVDLQGTVGNPVPLAGTGTDPDGDTVTFAWTFTTRPAGSAAALTNANTATPSFTPDAAGLYVVQLTTSDGRGGTATDSATITVTQPGGGNRAPVANAGIDRVVPAGALTGVNGQASSDPDPGTTLAFSWVFLSTPGAAPALQTPNQAIATFVPTALGEYRLELTVSDGSLSDRDTVVVTVVPPNLAPTITVGAVEPVFAGETATIPFTASDPNGDPLDVTLTLVDPPPGSTATPEIAPGGARIDTDVAGRYRVRITATDPGGLFSEAEVDVFANPNVAGIYDAHLILDATSCFGGNPQEGDVTLPVRQPEAGVVILDLPAVDSDFLNAPRGVLEGETFRYEGPLTVQTTDGPQSVDGRIDGTITAAGTMDLEAVFPVFGGCAIEATITGQRQ